MNGKIAVVENQVCGDTVLKKFEALRVDGRFITSSTSLEIADSHPPGAQTRRRVAIARLRTDNWQPALVLSTNHRKCLVNLLAIVGDIIDPHRGKGFTGHRMLENDLEMLGRKGGFRWQRKRLVSR